MIKINSLVYLEILAVIFLMIFYLKIYLDSVLASYAKAYKWELKPDNTYFIQNHEDTIKSRNIEEKLKFDRKFLIFFRNNLKNLECAEVLNF